MPFSGSKGPFFQVPFQRSIGLLGEGERVFGVPRRAASGVEGSHVGEGGCLDGPASVAELLPEHEDGFWLGAPECHSGCVLIGFLELPS